MNAEQTRLKDTAWKKWGPYVSDRQWGTVREDYSANGDAWNYVTHDMARSKAYRWNEEGIAGICDELQLPGMSPILTNTAPCRK
ncbi:MAG: glucosidase [Mucilaginibacter sp.]|nr:glucosidase [Mucilaginibacter sp.]